VDTPETKNQPNKVTSATNGIDILAKAWDDRQEIAVFATVDINRSPNAIYITEVRYLPGEGFVVAENYFHKTRANIQTGTRGAILFLTKGRKSFQAKGPLSSHTKGPIFEFMQSWHDPKLPGLAAVLLRVEEAYSGAEKLF
jgi:predicted pyridoxine 5'-phosphate oxidase superfamily flavin-nucleotide-binding protein